MNTSKKMKEIVTRMKKRREELKLSYEDLAKRTGFGKSTLQRYETGSINSMPIDRFEQLAEGLEIEPYKLMGWDEDYLLSQDKKDEADGDIVDLLNSFLKLNETGRKKVLEYTFDILSIDKYIQDNHETGEDDTYVKGNAGNQSDTSMKNNPDTQSNTYIKNNLSNQSDTYCSSDNKELLSDNSPSLSEMFTTIAAHNDGIEKDKEKEIDSIFLKAIMKEKNKMR